MWAAQQPVKKPQTDRLRLRFYDGKTLFVFGNDFVLKFQKCSVFYGLAGAFH